jgi:hypothetical protein
VNPENGGLVSTPTTTVSASLRNGGARVAACPPKAKVRGSNPFGRANTNNDLTASDILSADALSAECPRKRFGGRSERSTGDPPQKRSPASPASENGAHRELKCSKRKSTSARPDAHGPEQHFYWIADGQTDAGFVEQIGESYKAIAADERALGTFANLTAAADAVSAAYEAAR